MMHISRFSGTITIARAAALFVIMLTALIQGLDVHPEQPKETERRVLPLRAAPVSAPRVTRVKPVHSSVRWEGREHAVADGIDLLMGIIVNPATEPAVRAKALDKLGKLGTELRATNCIRELVQL